MFERTKGQNKDFGWLVNLKPFREKSLSGFFVYKVFAMQKAGFYHSLYCKQKELKQIVQSFMREFTYKNSSHLNIPKRVAGA